MSIKSTARLALVAVVPLPAATWANQIAKEMK